MNWKTATSLNPLMAIAICAVMNGQEVAPSSDQGRAPGDIQSITEKVVSTLYAHKSPLKRVVLSFPAPQKEAEKGELNFALKDTQSFLDGEGVFWFVSDRREHLDGKWSAIYFTSETLFTLSEPKRVKFQGHQDIVLPGEGPFNALVKRIPGYQLIPMEPFRSRLSDAIAEPIRVECEESVIGDLRGRTVYLRMPLRSAYFLDANNRYVLTVVFSGNGKPQHMVYYPDPQKRPQLDRNSTRPGFMDGNKIVSEPVRKMILNAVKAAKVSTQPR